MAWDALYYTTVYYYLPTLVFSSSTHEARCRKMRRATRKGKYARTAAFTERKGCGRGGGELAQMAGKTRRFARGVGRQRWVPWKQGRNERIGKTSREAGDGCLILGWWVVQCSRISRFLDNAGGGVVALVGSGSDV